MRRRELLKTGSVVLGTTALAGCLGGDDDEDEYPSETIEAIIPSAPGGSTNAYADQFMAVLGDEIGEDIAVTNIEGARGMRGVGEAYNADPDGYTAIVLALPHDAINFLVEEPEYRLGDMRGCGLFGFVPTGLAFSSDIDDFDELRQRYQDGEIETAGSFGTPGDIAIELVDQHADLGVERIVGYEGSGPIAEAILSGEIPAGTLSSPAAAPLVDDDEANYVVFSSQGSDLIPEAPTFPDLGYPNIDFVGQVTFGVWMPPDTPDEPVEIIESGMEAAIETERMQDWSDDSGLPIFYEDSESADELMSDVLAEVPEAIDLDEYR